MKKAFAKKIMEEVKKDYNSLALHFSRSREKPWNEIKFLFNCANPGEKILDLGCGNGRFAEFLPQADYTGVDFSESMIKEAKKRFPEKKFILADALSLPFEDNIFDKVYAIAFIHHIPGEKYRCFAVKEMERVLVPGGKAFLTAWDLSDYKKMLFTNALRNLLTPLGPRDIFLKRKKYYYAFKDKDFFALPPKAGLQVVEKGGIKIRKQKNFYLVAQKPLLAYNKRKKN